MNRCSYIMQVNATTWFPTWPGSPLEQTAIYSTMGAASGASAVSTVEFFFWKYSSISLSKLATTGSGPLPAACQSVVSHQLTKCKRDEVQQFIKYTMKYLGTLLHLSISISKSEAELAGFFSPPFPPFLPVRPLPETARTLEPCKTQVKLGQLKHNLPFCRLFFTPPTIGLPFPRGFAFSLPF